MRSMTIISLALLTGCATEVDFADLDDGSVLDDAQRITTRGDVTDDFLSESPLTPVREPKGLAFGTLDDWVPPGKLPEAQIEMECVNENCTQIYMTGESSDKADTFEWTVNDMVVSNAMELELVLPEIVEDSEEQSTLVNISLKVSNGSGSDTFDMGILNGLMAAPKFPGTVDPEPPERPVFTIVIGVRNCLSPVSITQFNGCLTTGLDINTTVTRSTSGSSVTQDLEYQAVTDKVVSVGLADGAAWLVDPNQSEQTRTDTNANNWSQFGTQRYPRVASAGARHLTSYYTLDPNDGSLTAIANHFIGAGASTSPSTLRLTCDFGNAILEKLDDGPTVGPDGGIVP